MKTMASLSRWLLNSIALFLVYVSLCGWFFIFPLPGGGAWDECEARSLIGKRDWNGLLEFSNKRLDNWPDRTYWLMHKAFALSNLGRAEETIPLLKKVTELQPEDEAAWTNLASAYNETKMHSEAVSAAQQAIRLKPDLGRHWFHLAWARYALGDKTGAKKDYDELAKRDVPLAKEFLRRFPVDDRFQPAVASAQEPSRPARAVEGIASAKPQSPEEAQQRAALQPNDYTAWLALGDSYKAVKEYDQAIRAYRQAIALKADYGLAIYGLGEIYHLLGDKERVRDMYLALGNADKQLANQYFRAFILP